jgi:L-asparaginase
MRTFVVYVQSSSEALSRVVLMLHRRVVRIESLRAEHLEDRNVMRICIRLEVDGDQALRIEASLYRLVDVLQVENPAGTESPGSEAAAVYRPSSMRVIYVITTGGTIEKEYFETTGSVGHRESKLDRYLRLLRLPGSEIRIVPLLNKDSLDMADSDRRLILGAVTALVPENAPIVITHGTDTMVQTGLFLQHSIADLNAPIILTGAMVPLGFDGSDALQNLTESLFAAGILNPGVYVVIHGEMFPIYRVRKDHAAGRFVWSDENLM